MVDRSDISAQGRRRLALVLQKAKELVAIDDVAGALVVDRLSAAKLLSRWQQQGWMKRVARGLYAPVPLDALTTGQLLTDPWVLVPRLFAPGYVGGWTAAEHWDFTEQLFRSIFVFTARPVHVKERTIQGAPFTLKHLREGAMFGTKLLWRDHARVAISDKHRTIVDLLDDPANGGGIRHVESCVAAYLRDSEADVDTLIRYVERLGNGAVFKRLGFLASFMEGQQSLAEACHARLTQGNAKLDPALPNHKLVKRWRLWIPEAWKPGVDRD